MKTVAFLPIKMNSQRLPHKNILLIGEMPLCWYVPHTLSKIQEIDETYVFCSDLAIKNYLPKGIKILQRDERLDADTVKGAEIYSEFIKLVDADIYVLAHTTSPFIQRETIKHALKKVQSEEYDSAFSVQKIQTFAWCHGKPVNYDLTDVPRTQDMEPVYIETSGFYIFRKEVFTQHRRRIGFKPYLQGVTEKEAIDIDTKADYERACFFHLREAEHG